MKTFAAFLILLFVPVSNNTMDCRKTAKKALQYSVLIHALGTTPKGEIVGIGCSGTYISPKEILTAAHCFEGYELKKAWARGNEDSLGYPIKLVAYDKGLDLALVKTAYPHKYAKLGLTPSVGSDIVNVGSPLGFEFVISQGVVAVKNYIARPFTGRYTVTTAYIDHGSSGGGAFDKSGHLVGVNCLSVWFFGWSGLSLAVNAETIKVFIERVHSFN